ncbi:MAG: metal ABC transporter ATP-binding protein [Mycoplasmatales bacterium]
MIKIDDLTFGFNNQVILKNMNLDINDKDFIAIIGENGSGKSTFIKCLLGINKIKCSTVMIDGICINKYDEFINIGYVPQFRIKESEIPITVKEYLGLIAKDKNKLLTVINDFALEDIINNNINKLSGGQKQRVFLARALLHDVKYLILDEPTAGLDFESRKQLYALIGSLNKNGMTIIIVSHHLNEISCKINKIYNMDTNTLEEVHLDDCEYC